MDFDRNKFARYTIGITNGEHNNIKGNMVVDYYFAFASIKYTKSKGTGNWYFDKPITHGGRYYVRFAFNNPVNSDLLFDKPIPNNVINAPDSGWSYMPGYEQMK